MRYHPKRSTHVRTAPETIRNAADFLGSYAAANPINVHLKHWLNNNEKAANDTPGAFGVREAARGGDADKGIKTYQGGIEAATNFKAGHHTRALRYMTPDETALFKTRFNIKGDIFNDNPTDNRKE